MFRGFVSSRNLLASRVFGVARRSMASSQGSDAAALSPDAQISLRMGTKDSKKVPLDDLSTTFMVPNRADPELSIKFPRILQVLNGQLKLKELTYTERVALSAATYKNKSHAGRGQRKSAARMELQSRVDERVRELMQESKEVLLHQERERQVQSVNSTQARKARKAERQKQNPEAVIPKMDWSARAEALLASPRGSK